jgi:Rnl2 family RNA ligase
MLKYPSMIGERHEESISYLRSYPAFADAKWMATEKIDGSNFSVRFDREGVKLFSRTQEITSAEFNGLQRILLPILFQPWAKALHAAVPKNYESVTLFGEIFGAGINKRVYYGKSKYVRFFDILINDEVFQSYSTLQTLAIPAGYLAPVLATDLTLEEALAFTFNEDSRLTPANYPGQNIAEGAVLRLQDCCDNYAAKIRPILKRRNPAFLEGALRIIPSVVTDKKLTIKQLNEQFCELINENRAINLMSKFPELPIPEAIPLLLADAKEDFWKTVSPESVNCLEPAELKALFNAGGKPFHILNALRNQK